LNNTATGADKDLIKKLSPLGKCPYLFDKLSLPLAFFTEVKPPSANWKGLAPGPGKHKPEAKYGGAKGQHRKAYRMLSSRRAASVKILRARKSSRYINILQLDSLQR